MKRGATSPIPIPLVLGLTLALVATHPLVAKQKPPFEAEVVSSAADQVTARGRAPDSRA